MISEVFLIFIVAVAVVLMLYSVLDLHNLLYANIVAGLISTVLWVISGLMLLTGSSGCQISRVVTESLNTTTNVTAYAYEVAEIPATDPVLSLVFTGIGAVMGVYTIAMGLVAFYDVADRKRYGDD